MNERVLYYTHEEKRYRFKVADTSVFLERQPSPGYGALSQETFSLDTFPVLNELYWDETELKRLIQWYEVDMGEITSDAYRIPPPDSAPTLVDAALKTVTEGRERLSSANPNHCQIIPRVSDLLNTFEPNPHEKLLRAMFDEPELPRDAQDDEKLWAAIAEASGMTQQEFDEWMDTPSIGAPDDSLVGAVSPVYHGDKCRECGRLSDLDVNGRCSDCTVAPGYICPECGCAWVSCNCDGHEWDNYFDVPENQDDEAHREN